MQTAPGQMAFKGTGTYESVPTSSTVVLQTRSSAERSTTESLYLGRQWIADLMELQSLRKRKTQGSACQAPPVGNPKL